MTTNQKLFAEALGTALLVATVVGSGIMADRLSADDAVSLLGNTLATGAILVVLITLLGPVSGAHFNPAVTLVFALKREIAPALAVAYIAVQCLGGVTGAMLANAMFDLPLVEMSAKVRTGPSQWLSETVAAFGLVLTILGTLRYAPERVALQVGLYITAAYWFTASTSFANPAVTLARAFSDTFAGIRLIDIPAFTLAQIAGALLALFIANWLFRKDP